MNRSTHSSASTARHSGELFRRSPYEHRRQNHAERERQPPVDIAAVTAHFNVVARQEAPLLDAVLESGAIFVP
jgi:hypothetical protein